MKKLYSLLCAVAVTALAANAATPTQKEAVSRFPLEATISKSAPLKVAADKTIRKVADNGAPADLKDTKLMAIYTIIEQDQAGNITEIPASSELTFTYVQDQEGLQLYYMSGLLSNNYSSVLTWPNLTVGYDPTDGTIIIPTNQTITQYNGADFQMFVQDEEENLVQLQLWMEYKDGEFVLTRDREVQWQGEDRPEPFNIMSVLIGRLVGQNVSVLIEFDLSKFVPFNATMSWTMTTNSGAQNSSETIAAVMTGDKELTVCGFAGMTDVPMTIDSAAKTLTATDVTFGNINIGTSTEPVAAKLMLSDANLTSTNIDNAAGEGKYVLTSTYAVQDGKTTITVHDWNGFYVKGGVEDYYFWPMSNTKIELDFDLDAKVAGVEDIVAGEAVDANAPVEYFNLQGQRVAEPAAGLYIKRQGKTVSKVVIR